MAGILPPTEYEYVLLKSQPGVKCEPLGIFASVRSAKSQLLADVTEELKLDPVRARDQLKRIEDRIKRIENAYYVDIVTSVKVPVTGRGTGRQYQMNENVRIEYAIKPVENFTQFEHA